MARRPPPAPPHAGLLRRPSGPFGWVDAALLRDGWLADLGANATAVLLLLALAADRHGASFYGRSRIAKELGMTRDDVDQALDRLLASGLVAHRPWRPGHLDGVWQVLSVPERKVPQRAGRTLAAADVLRRLGFVTASDQTAE